MKHKPLNDPSKTKTKRKKRTFSIVLEFGQFYVASNSNVNENSDRHYAELLQMDDGIDRRNLPCEVS